MQQNGRPVRIIGIINFKKIVIMISVVVYAVIAFFSFSVGVHFFFTQKGEPTAKEKTIFLGNFIGLFAIGFSFGVSWGGYSAEQKCEQQKAEPANKKQALQDSVAILELEQKLQTLKQSK